MMKVFKLDFDTVLLDNSDVPSAVSAHPNSKNTFISNQ